MKPFLAEGLATPCAQQYFYLFWGITEKTKQCDFKFPCIKSL